MPPLSTRPVQRADLVQLCEMITALAAHHGDDATLNIDKLHTDIFGALPWIHVSVACDGDNVVGYHALCPLIQLQYCLRGIDIHHLFVSPEHRRKGVGRLLINDAANRAKALGCGYLMVGTAPDNIAAQNTYLACRFVRTEHNPNRFNRSLN